MKYTLVLMLALLFTACSSGAAVQTTTAILGNYSLVPEAGFEAMGEMDLFGAATATGGEFRAYLGRKSDRVSLYEFSASLGLCEGIALRADGDTVELVHLRGAEVPKRFPFLACGGEEGAKSAQSEVLWRGR